jgi:hypothetical protein
MEGRRARQARCLELPLATGELEPEAEPVFFESLLLMIKHYLLILGLGLCSQALAQDITANYTVSTKTMMGFYSTEGLVNTATMI